MPETRRVKVNDLWTECPWAMPKFDEQNCHPFQFETMKHYQSHDNNVLNLPFINPDEFLFQIFGSHELVCCTTGDQHLIVLTDDMLPHLATWYHHLNAHAEGMVWLETSMQCHFWHSNLRGEIWNQWAHVTSVPRWKRTLPRKDNLLLVMSQVFHGLKLMSILLVPSQGVAAKFWAMMIIDPATNLVETFAGNFC